MLLKKVLMFMFMLAYLYILCFEIFMTDLFRIPAPIIFGIPLIFLFKENFKTFLYVKETIILICATFLYDVIALGNLNTFFANVIIISICALYFNYFIGLNKERFNLSVIAIYAFLFISALVMVFDHTHQSLIDPIREILLNDQIKQSPAGIAATQFTFGYQLAALASFLFIFTCAFQYNFLFKLIVLCVCITFLYLGMNRSAFVSFVCTTLVFLILFYRFKSVIMIGAVAAIGLASYTYIIKDNFDSRNNILAKNEGKEANDYNRAHLFEENLKIYSSYPFGLIFYGAKWEQVTYRSPVFVDGVSSHNAYLMFLTYLGPFLGFGILIAVYYKVIKVFFSTIKDIHLKENALLICLFFSFIAISINSLSHNAWLISVNGPTLFLYFGIVHYSKIRELEKI